MTLSKDPVLLALVGAIYSPLEVMTLSTDANEDS